MVNIFTILQYLGCTVSRGCLEPVPSLELRLLTIGFLGLASAWTGVAKADISKDSWPPLGFSECLRSLNKVILSKPPLKQNKYVFEANQSFVVGLKWLPLDPLDSEHDVALLLVPGKPDFQNQRIWRQNLGDLPKQDTQ